MNLKEKIKNYKKLDSLIFYAVIFAIIFVFSILKMPADLDLWHRLAVGKIFSQTGHVLYHDIFSYFPTKTLWIDEEWLSGVVFYNLIRYFGDFGIISLKLITLFTAIVVIYKINSFNSPVRNKYKIIYYFLIILALMPGFASTIRCQAFTYLFFAFWIYLFERIRQGENRLFWIFPFMTIIWANLHGGFLAGIGLICIYAFGEFLNGKNPLKYILLLILCVVASFINPYGIKYWNYLISAISLQRPYTDEWLAFNFFGNFFEDLGVKILFLLLIFAFIYEIKPFIITNKEKFLNRLIIFTKTKIDWTVIILFLVTLYLGFSHQRHLIFFVIAAGAFLYRYCSIILNNTFLRFEKIIKKRGLIKDRMFYLLEFSAIIACVFITFTTPVKINLDDYPVKSVEFIKINKLEGNLLVPFNWGSYALWKLYPQNLVSSDGRYDGVYTNKSLIEANLMELGSNSAEWNRLLNYHHDVILIPTCSLFYKELLKMKNWSQVYKDNKSAVFIPSVKVFESFIQPNQDKNYYLKTKFENNINF